MVDRQVKLIYAEVKVGDKKKKPSPLNPAYSLCSATQSVALHKLIVTMEPKREEEGFR